MTSLTVRGAMTWGLLAIPLLAALAALAGALLDPPVAVTVVGAAAVGGVVAGLVAYTGQRRVAGLAQRLQRVARGEPTEAQREARGAPTETQPGARSGSGEAPREARGEPTEAQREREHQARGGSAEAQRGSWGGSAEAQRGSRDKPANAYAHGPWGQAEAALDAVAESLQQRVDEARRLDAVRRDFVTNASHELKTPVAAIQALSESLELAFDRDPERARVMVARLQTEGARLGTMVRDLLDLARLEEVSVERSRSRVDVAEVVAGQMERLASAARQRGVEMRTGTLEEAVVLGLPEDVRLIAGNLLENAVRYNREGGSVEVAVTRRDTEVIIEVADTGVGIPEADRERVFERFYRVDKGRSRAAGGTGLGLALVRHAVQRAGGRVELQSVVGEGSTFTVVLPADPGA